MSMQDIIEKLKDNPEEARVVLACNFALFIKVFHFHLRREKFIFKPFHLTLIKKLEDIVFGKNEKQNLAISISPRTGKSLIVKYFLAWAYGVNKNCQNIYTSYSDKLIQKFSGEIRDLINSDLYRQIFGIELKHDTQSKSLWNIQGGGGLIASPMGGTITGFGAGGLGDNYAGALVIDDPLKADDYKSEAERQNCLDFYIDTLKSRRENLDKTPIIVIMQRLHREDLIGWLLELPRRIPININTIVAVINKNSINDPDVERIMEERDVYEKRSDRQADSFITVIANANIGSERNVAKEETGSTAPISSGET